MSIRERKLGLFSAKMANHCSCRSALLQNKCSSSCSAVLQNKCRRSQIYTISSGPIDSKKSCSAKTSHGLSSVSKQERSSLAKSHLSKGSPIVKKRKPEEDLVDTIRKKPTVDCEMAARFSKDLMGLLMSHEYARVFSSPVDVVKLGLRDYFETVKYPMDLGTVKKKMELGVYFLDPLRFSCDVRLTFSNAMIYNPPTHDAHVMAKKLSEFFELRWKPILKKLLVTHRAWDEDLSSYHRLGTGLLASEKKPTSEPGNLCVNSITNKKTSSSPEVDERKRGVSLLCSRLSPGKHDRVSILLSRFSDINIKSQEQGLGVARKDRGKLDQRQKQFDLQTKEENGHLVKSKIEVLKDKFSAERKRKRELEREAARLAINKIEKTVDIYDYYNYRKDLVTYAILCSSGDESRLGEINERDLLEHLGLYLKMEDEEEEDRDL